MIIKESQSLSIICDHYGYLLLAALEDVETPGEDRLTEIR